MLNLGATKNAMIQISAEGEDEDECDLSLKKR